MITICFTYFRSLTLANLRASLYSVQQQDMSCVDSIVVLDNNTDDDAQDIQAVIDALAFSVPVHLISIKHGDATKTHSWSSNIAVSWAFTPWVLFTRADYLLEFDVVKKFVEIAGARASDWDGFVTGNVYHLAVDIAECEKHSWRRGLSVLQGLPGAEADYTKIDAGVWLARRVSFDRVRGLDEILTAWGHAQTDFQYRLHATGTEFVRIPEVLFYHPQHAAPRDINLAHQQLRDLGIDIRQLWKRHEGVQPYASL